MKENKPKEYLPAHKFFLEKIGRLVGLIGESQSESEKLILEFEAKLYSYAFSEIEIPDDEKELCNLVLMQIDPKMIFTKLIQNRLQKD